MLCSTTYRYFIQNFLDAVEKISTKLSGGYFSDTLLVELAGLPEEALEAFENHRSTETKAQARPISLDRTPLTNS